MLHESKLLAASPRLVRASVPAAAAVVSLASAACSGLEITPIIYECETSAEASYLTEAGYSACGADDPNLPPEPTLPADVCATLVANKSGPYERDLDTTRINQALQQCVGRAVKLVRDGKNDSFVAGHLTVEGVTLWVDEGVTLYASRDPELFQQTGNCGRMGINDSGACNDFITVGGTSPAIVGEGKIDGQGGEPLVGRDYSWWEASGALREINGSIGNPTLIKATKKTTGFVLYRITLHDAAKFHVKITSNPADGTCSEPGEGFIIWGVTILTPRRWYNSRGVVLSPHWARNTDGIDPGTTAAATCGVIACNTVSTGDDQIAIKGGHHVSDLIIAHNHFGTGHGMSIGSETYGIDPGPTSQGAPGTQNVTVYDLTIDADSRWVGRDTSGHPPSSVDFNGIRVKSDESRGGVVNNIVYRDICMRDVSNAILVSTAYNPLFGGNEYPDFGALEFENIRSVTCKGIDQTVVTLEGFNAVRRLGPVTLNNVVLDNIGPQAVFAEYADIELGPGSVNFRPVGRGVRLTNNITGDSKPRKCVFPELPQPEGRPDDWGW